MNLMLSYEVLKLTDPKYSYIFENVFDDAKANIFLFTDQWTDFQWNFWISESISAVFRLSRGPRLPADGGPR